MAAINELDAFCISLPLDLCPTSGPGNVRLMPVVLVEHVGHHTLGRHIPTSPAWDVIGRICRDRASMTVDHSLLVNGMPISPEHYIKRWRVRVENPVPLSRLALDKGMQAVAVFQWRHSPELAARKASWVNPAFACFGDLLAAHGRDADEVTLGQGERPLSTLKVDLAAPGGARAAWWADDFLCSTSIERDVVSRRMKFHRVPYDAQPVVFHRPRAQHAPQAQPAHI